MSIFTPVLRSSSSSTVIPRIPSVSSVVPATIPRFPSNESFNSLGKYANKLYDLLYDTSYRLMIITGAGISTESGIPDYRSPGRPLYKPLLHKDFMTSEYTRRRYWARSTLGFRRMKNAQPNTSHYALSMIEKGWKETNSIAYLQSLLASPLPSQSYASPPSLATLRNHPVSVLHNSHRATEGRIHTLITQNVDRLHHMAGQRNIIELHGNIHEVQCLKCQYTLSRTELQTILDTLNQEWLTTLNDGYVPTVSLSSHSPSSSTSSTSPVTSGTVPKQPILVRPDGDIELPDEAYDTFRIPPCPHCHEEWLKPNVVFYGGSVPSDVTEIAKEAANNCDGVLLIGSTASTFSAFRIIRDIAQRNKPVGILNYGPTRADPLAHFKIEGHVGDILSMIVQERQRRIM